MNGERWSLNINREGWVWVGVRFLDPTARRPLYPTWLGFLPAFKILRVSVRLYGICSYRPAPLQPAPLPVVEVYMMCSHRPKDAIDQFGNLDGCVALERLYDGPLVRLVHWTCLRDGPQLRSERFHDHVVLGLMHSGTCQIHHGRRATLLDPNCVILHSPGSPYRVTHPFGCGDRGVHLVVRSDAALDLVRRLAPRLADRWCEEGGQPAGILPVPSRDFLRQLLLTHELREGQDALAVEEITLELLAWMVRNLEGRSQRPAPARAGTREDHHHLAETTRSLLQGQFRDPLSVDDLARTVHASPFHLCRVFKRETGLPLHRYRTRLRLAAAVDQLTASDGDLARLALDLGFASHSHLTTAFRREFGVPPSKVRRGTLP